MCRSEKVTFVVLAWLVLHERVRERGGWGGVGGGEGWGVLKTAVQGPQTVHSAPSCKLLEQHPAASRRYDTEVGSSSETLSS